MFRGGFGAPRHCDRDRHDSRVGQKVEIDAPKPTHRASDPGLADGLESLSHRHAADIDFYLHGPVNLDEHDLARGKLEDVNEAFRAMKAGEVSRTVLMFE